MDKKTFEKVCHLVYDKSGINLTEKKEALVRARLTKRVRALGLTDEAEYLKYLYSDKSGTELVELLDVISTNVTHFFREDAHFEVLGKVLKELESQGQKRIRIWCAAASSGEEPYSIAITVMESMRDHSDTKILATDISTRVLRKCVEGVYREDSVSRMPERYLKKYFDPIKEDGKVEYKIRQQPRDKVKFGRLNLIEIPYPMHGPLDIVFIRNVMIYFDNNVRRKVLAEIYRLMRPGGFLMVGHSESLTGQVSEFKSVMPAVYIKSDD